MIQVIQFFILAPLAGFVISLILPPKKENIMSWLVFVTVGLHLIVATCFLLYWLIHGMPVLSLKDVVLYRLDSYEFSLGFYFDRITATFLFVGSLLTFLVAIYSRYYLHREKGYKRFFNTIFFFFLGYNVVIFSGNFETLFVGWEILGISSFLLIAFYRERYIPVRNAVKVFSVYRIGDVGLVLVIWLSHHLWNANVTFLKLSDYDVVHSHLQSHTLIGMVISMLLLLTAAAKSAQLPFSSWLPRAMEGPTPSSAIFYGSLAVHLGIFLLLRTFPFWGHQMVMRLAIGLVGLTTSIVATGIARVQSNVKSQIAYASTAQIGLIFIEVAAGFELLALFHLCGNAFLRTYQLLVSPSVVTYLIREQFYSLKPRPHVIVNSLYRKVVYSFYLLCIREFNLDEIAYRYCRDPLKWLGKKMDFLNVGRVLILFVPLYLAGLYLTYHKAMLGAKIEHAFSIVCALIALVLVLKSFSERVHARLSWLLVIMNHFWVALAVSFNEQFAFDQVHVYLSGIASGGIIGFLCLRWLKKAEGNIDLDRFHGHSYKHPRLALLFLLCCLAASGFPITPTFIGEDLMFSHIHEDQVIFAFMVSLSFIIDGLAIIRIYARVFLGPHVKSQYEMAWRSS